MKRIAEFLRSVIPADPAQLLFLAGSVCLVIAPHLSWWPRGFEIASAHREDWLNLQIPALRGLISFPIILAGVAAYFIAFWPGPRPVRRILSYVYLPTLSVLAILSLRSLYLVDPYRSVLETPGFHGAWPLLAILKLSGPQFCLAGLLLIGIFMARLIGGRSTFPLALPSGSVQRHDHPTTWHRTQLLIWLLIGPLFLTTILVLLPVVVSVNVSHFLQRLSLSTLIAAAQMLLVLAIASYIIGSSARPLLRRAFRLPSEKSILLAAGFAIGIPVAISAGEYLWERAQFVRHDVGAITWEPGTYLHLPEVWLLLLFFPALFEEIIFRGFLQPRLAQRYGLHRGIFLVGIIWAAFHFPSDFRAPYLGDLDVTQTLFYRLFICITLSFVFGWLTLETGSVLAAAFAHTFFNVLIYSDLGPPFPGKNWLRLALWAALAWLLFRYWPVKRELKSPETVQVAESTAPPQSAPAQPSPEPENS